MIRQPHLPPGRARLAEVGIREGRRIAALVPLRALRFWPSQSRPSSESWYSRLPVTPKRAGQARSTQPCSSRPEPSSLCVSLERP